MNKFPFELQLRRQILESPKATWIHATYPSGNEPAESALKGRHLKNKELGRRLDDETADVILMACRNSDGGQEVKSDYGRDGGKSALREPRRC